MNSLSKKIQKIFVYTFTGVSVLLVILGISRIKKSEPLAQTSPSGTRPKLVVLGASVSANFTGKSYSTPWGDVATQIKVTDGKIVAVSIPTLPDSPPSTQAEPYLISQALKAGGSNIQGITGATFTSRAFQASLESALAQAANTPSGAKLATSAITSTPIALPVAIPVVVTPPPLLPRTVTTKTPATTSSGVSGTFKGNTYQTPWGNAVASITVANGKITGVTMPQVPNSPPSQYAEPYLIQQAIAAGSANIQGVSGATYTSIAFKSSLESAISLANTTANASGKAAIVPGTTTTVAAPVTTSYPRRYRYNDD